MDALERVLRSAGLPVRFTEGFNPHIRLSMGPALSLGHQGDAEIFDVDCTAPVRPQHIAKINSLLPDGVVVSDAQPLLPGAPSLGKLVAAERYRIEAFPDRFPWPRSTEGLDDDIRAGVRRWQVLNDGNLLVELNARQGQGPIVSVKRLLRSLGLESQQVARLLVTRESLVLEPRKSKRESSENAPKARVS